MEKAIKLYILKVISKRMQLLRDDAINNNNGFEDSDSKKESIDSSLNGRIIIDILLKRFIHQSPEDDMVLSPEIIKSEVNTFILGGHDTTAMALTFSTLMIGHHEQVQRRVRE